VHDTTVFFFHRGLIYWIIVGLLAGWVTGKIVRGAGFGCLGNVILGLIGAVIGGWIFSRIGLIAYNFIGSLAAATVGAVVLVSIGRLFSSSRD
jgi:uncharacterized membrane protein YeaQ/YmgE (transglycosylase-associated protein family)